MKSNKWTNFCNFVLIVRLLIVISLLFIPFGLKASHIVGGDMYYDCLGGNSYRITVKIYRDCLSDGAEFDPNLPVTIFNGSNVQIGHFTIPFPGSTTLDVILDNPCITVPGDICIEEAIYTKIVDLPPSSNGYVLSYQRCCRGPAVTNLTDPDLQGLTLQIDIPPAPLATCNSSARFINYPPLVTCTDQEIVFNHAAVDPDGDDLVYELCTPFQGGTDLAPAPDPASPPPYDPIIWAPGISALSPFSAGSLTIDPSTGMLVGTPEAPGLYVIGVCVKEYRDGVLISVSRRDFLLKVLNCDIELDAKITPQNELSTFVSYCNGLEIQFENESFGGDFYAWDFGVPGTETDVSSEFAPTFTFPTGGEYDVTLIVNPGWPCTDTSVQTFVVQNRIEATFIPPDPQCITGNSFDFFGDGIFPADGATFEWDFGVDATPSSSTDLNPTNIVFETPGFHDVKFNVYYEVCHVRHTETIQVYKEPTINFSIKDELKCAPYDAKFVNMSFADTEMFYAWDFGEDGATSSVRNPTYTYTDVGVYDVTLTVWTVDGCVDTLTLNRPGLVEVFPRPTSIFSIDPDVQDEYHADFLFTDASIDAVEIWYYFEDGSFSQEPIVWHNYTEPGVYYPYQIVKNEYGCTDKSYQKLTVIPVIPILVPNAFTPDGNAFNNVFKPVFYEPQVFQLFIYNRWGELVYAAHEYEASWNGTFNGNLVEDGVYLWKIIYTAYDTKIPVEVQGHVTVLK